MYASEIMTEDPMTADARTTLREALEILQTLEVRHLPVVSSTGELIGVISDRDIRNSSTPFTLFATEAGAPEALAIEAMSSNPVTIAPDTDVPDIIDRLLENRIGALPVVDPSTNQLLGIVSYVDVLRAVRELV